MRIIIPYVFYHGKSKWKISKDFSSQFKIDNSLKKYVLNFKYLLFDTNDHNIKDNEKLKNNIFLFTAIILMKNIYRNDINLIEDIFTLWSKYGILNNGDNIIFFKYYIYHTQAIKRELIDKIIDERKLGGDDMPVTIASRLRDEGRDEGRVEGIEIGLKRGKKIAKEEVKLEEKIDIAKKMIDNGMEIKLISKMTGLSIEEINKLL